MTATAGAPLLGPGATLGILGGGQLGRMLSLAAARLGIRSHIYCPDADRPAAQVAAAETVASYDDEAALAAFARQVDLVTFEFENVPASTAEFLDRLTPVRPSPRALAIAQDRYGEKCFLREAGIETAAFADASEPEALGAAVAKVGVPAVLKTRRLGYDGKGQCTIAVAEDAPQAWASLGAVPAILESFVPFSCELSVIVARGLDGRTACYDPAHNTHRHHVLARSIVPAGIDDEIAVRAREIAEAIVAKLDYVGVMGVEMFMCGPEEPTLYVNELAPRVHNSGHWTLDACMVSQFEQHVRAISGWPLGSAQRQFDAVMDNLLGDAVARWRELSRERDTAIHIYGKDRAVPGRKMGHATRLYPLGTGPRGEAVPPEPAQLAEPKNLKANP